MEMHKYHKPKSISWSDASKEEAMLGTPPTLVHEWT
jgi:hypothetical protein